MGIGSGRTAEITTTTRAPFVPAVDHELVRERRPRPLAGIRWLLLV